MKRSTRRSTTHPEASGRSRRLLATSLAAGMLVALAACGDDGGDGGGDGGTGGSDAQLLNDGQLVAAMSGEFRPFSHFEDNELTGFDYDIAAAIAEEMDLELQAETGAFDTLIQGLISNRYDVLVASMTPTEERDQAVDFTDSYYTSGATMFVRTDSDCEDPTQMDGPTVGVASGTTYETFLKEEDWVGEIRTFTSDVTALQDVDAGRLDGAMTDRLVGLYQIEQADRDLRACGDPLYSEEPAFAVKEGNSGLLDDLNAALATIKEDGTYAEVSEKWFGQDIS
jgi:polar amino acid transport system substrate-binding protein